MSQPVRRASAPRLAPPRRNRRRVRSGISFSASLTRRAGSTPGGFLRMRDILGSGTSSLTADDYGAQRLRNDKAHDDVNDEKGDDCGHGEKVDVAGRRITAK